MDQILEIKNESYLPANDYNNNLDNNNGINL